MKTLITLLTIFMCLTIKVDAQTRSGNYGHPIYWFNRYKHKIPVVNQIPAPPAITIGAVIDAITDRRPHYCPDPSIEQIYVEYLELDSLTQDSIRQVLHPNWTQDRFNKSQSAVYRTYKYNKHE